MPDLKITVKQWTTEEKNAIEGFYGVLRGIWDKMTPWYQLEAPFSEEGAMRFRNNMQNGGDGWPVKPLLNDIARDVSFPSRSGFEGLYLRTFKPQEESKGVYLHIHGGGWVLGAANGEDTVLNRIAKNTGYTVMSVEYRLAPRYPYPTPIEDCIDAALFLLEPKSVSEFGPLRVIGGESAGGHLSMVTIMALRKHGVDLKAQLDAAVFNYGCYDMSGTPSSQNFKDNLILGRKDMQNFNKAWVPNEPDLQIPEISPLFEPDFAGLPSAIFVVGSDDALYDDSLFAAIKWHMGGNVTELSVFPGSKHGVCRIGGPDSEAALTASEVFIKEHSRIK